VGIVVLGREEQTGGAREAACKSVSLQVRSVFVIRGTWKTMVDDTSTFSAL
jgi:hypothetical protein